MSLIHMEAVLVYSNEYIAKYSIRSSDLNEDMKWEEIGILTINKIDKRYQFYLSGEYSNINFIPPSFYGLNLTDEEQESHLRTQYKDYCCGAWSMTIHHWAVTFINNNEYPDRHP